MQSPDETVLYSADRIQARVTEMARAIASDRLRPDVAVPILAGAFMFAADLLRALAREGLNLETDFVWLRAYGNKREPGDVTVLGGPSEVVRNRNVLLIDGVLESGTTAERARRLLVEAGAKAVRFAVVVRKPHACAAIAADYVGFDAGREFLYGYGMDSAGAGRGLPDIRIRTA
jgi:hypoxanthine phosphoribosyltransferase